MAQNKEEFVIELIDRVSKKLDRIDGKFNKVRATSGKLQKKTGGLGKSMGAMGKLLPIAGFAALGFGALSLGKKISSLGAELEQAKVAFGVFLGSARNAEIMIKRLNEFSNVTPFENKKVIAASKTLLAFGFTADEIIPTMTMLGDVSAGTGKDLKEMGRIFGKIKGNGRLMGEELNQLVDAGFNPLNNISKKTGKTQKEVRKEMEKGNISFKMVKESFKDATSEGGMFFKMMEKQSKTFAGRVSTFKGKLDFLLSKGGEGLNKFLSKIVEFGIGFIDNIQPVLDGFAFIGETVKDLFSPLGELMAAFGSSGDAASSGATAASIFGGALKMLAVNLKIAFFPMKIMFKIITSIVLVTRDYINDSPRLLSVIASIGKAFNRVKFFLDNFKATMAGIGAVLDRWIIRPVAKFTSVITTFFDSIDKRTKGIQEGFVRIAKSAIGAFIKMNNWLVNKLGFGTLMDKVSDTFGKAFDKTKKEEDAKAKATNETKATDIMDASKFAGAGKIPGVNLGAGGGGVGGPSAGISEVRSGAPKVFNININKLVETMSFETLNMEENTEKVKKSIIEAMLTAVNDTQIAVG